jgi:hypothetical protein
MEDPMHHQLLDTDAALAPLLQAAQETVTTSAAVSTLRALVLKIIQEPDIFVGLDEIKQVLLPALQQSGADGEKILRTLDLFSYGTCQDYHKDPSLYLPLSAPHIFKLRQLTVLSTVQQACLAKRNVVTLLEFQQALLLQQQQPPLENEAALAQEVVISCIYQRVIAAQLCQKTASLIISSRNGPPCRARDVAPHQVATLLQQVQQWQGRLIATNIELGQDQHQVLTALETHRLFCQQAADRMKKAEANGSSNSNSSLTGQVRQQSAWAEAVAGDAMDLSGSGHGHTAGSSRRQKRSRGGWSGVGGFGAFQP